MAGNLKRLGLLMAKFEGSKIFTLQKQKLSMRLVAVWNYVFIILVEFLDGQNWKISLTRDSRPKGVHGSIPHLPKPFMVIVASHMPTQT